MDKDLEHLRILSICYYVSAGITALFSCFPLIHLFFGIAMVSGVFPDNGKGDSPAFIGFFFIGIASVIILCGWAIAIATFFAGKSIGQRKNYVFCLVMAGISCASFPIGTTLGVFTFIVLLRDSVKPLFKGNISPNSNNFDNAPHNWQ